MAPLTRSLSAICSAVVLVLFAPITDAQTSTSNSLLAQAIQSTLTRRWPPSDQLSWLVLDTASGQVLARQWSSLDDPIPVGSLTKPFVALAYARTHPTFPHTLCQGTQDFCWLPEGHGTLDPTTPPDAGTDSSPARPAVGFLLVHHGSAMNLLLQSIAKPKTVKVAEHQPLPQVPSGKGGAPQPYGDSGRSNRQ